MTEELARARPLAEPPVEPPDVRPLVGPEPGTVAPSSRPASIVRDAVPVQKARPRRRWWSVAEIIDGVSFGFAGLASAWLALLLLVEGVRPGWPLLLLVLFWLLVTYLVLPRVHHILSRLYVPGYFIGRTRTSDGLLGDPVNLAFRGAEEQVHEAMRAAGWHRADDLTWRSGRRMVQATLRRRSYPEAPVSPLLLFDRQQDFAYQQEVAGSPSKRHHVRFWRCPPDWLLPGGYAVDWMAAGTYDRAVGLSLFTLQITHKIDANTDVERDHIVTTMCAGDQAVEVSVIKDFATGYHSRNGGGDLIETDGDLPVVDVGSVRPAADAPAASGTDSRNRRPAQIVVGAAAAFLQASSFLAVGFGVLAGWGLPDLDAAPGDRWPLAIVLWCLAVPGVVLGVAVLRGHRWARFALLITSAMTVISTFADTVNAHRFTPTSDLSAVAINILVLLALSSLRARDFTTHRVVPGDLTPGSAPPPAPASRLKRVLSRGAADGQPNR